MAEALELGDEAFGLAGGVAALVVVADFGTFQGAPMPPAFTRFAPAQFVRPSR